MASEIGLSDSEYAQWLTLPKGEVTVVDSFSHGEWTFAKRTISTLIDTDVLCSGQDVEIPNTIIAFWGGVLGGFGKWWVQWNADIHTLEQRGFRVARQSATPIRSSDPNYLQRSEAQIRSFLGDLALGTGNKEPHGIFFWGHGGFSLYAEPGKPLQAGTRSIAADELRAHLKYELGLGVLWGCEMYDDYLTLANRKGIFSRNAIVAGGHGTLYPHGFHLFGKSLKELLPPGAQGTRR